MLFLKSTPIKLCLIAQSILNPFFSLWSTKLHAVFFTSQEKKIASCDVIFVPRKK